MNAVWPVQVALYALLSGDAQLRALLAGDGVYDDVPQRAQFPYVVIGDEMTETAEDTHTDRGSNATITLHAWSEYRGSREVAAIMTRIDQLLHRQRLDLGPDHRMVSMAREFVTILREGEDGELRHGVIRYRVITMEV